MLIRISLILAIVAALAVAGLNFTMVKNKVTTLQNNYVTTSNTLVTTEKTLKKTKTDLEKTSAQLTQTNNALVAAVSERDKAISDADAATRRAADLTENLNTTKKTLSDAQDELAIYHQSGYTGAQVLQFAKQIKDLQDNLAGSHDENKLLSDKLAKLQYQLDKYIGKIKIVYLPPTLKGKILVSDPKWDFVVLDIGEAQGVKQDGELLVSRNGKLVAKVVVRSLQKDRSIANVMPGWKLGEVMEGDQVIPAHPES
jgi:hypothetical protein